MNTTNGTDIENPASEAMRELETWVPEAVPVLPRVRPEEVFRDWSRAKWLEDLARLALESSDPLENLAGAGAIGRLWLPTDSKERARLVEEMLDGSENPIIESSVAPFRRLTNEQRDQLDSLATARSSLFSGLFDEVQHDVEEGDDRARRSARALLLERDDLESILLILSELDSGSQLRAALEVVDEEARLRIDVVDLADPENHPRLSAVSWQDPQAWWGRRRRE
jgi:hypothetical protein